MLPVVELRGALPYGISLGLNPWLAFVTSVVGNILPAPFIRLFIRKIFSLLRRIPKFNAFIDRLEKRGSDKSDLVDKYGMLGLVILVAIPLPGTGAWTGALAAAMMNMRLKRAMPAIFLGVVIAGIIILCISRGVFALL